MLAEGAADVGADGGIVLKEVLCLPSMERVGGFKCLLEVLGACSVPVGLRLGSTVSRGTSGPLSSCRGDTRMMQGHRHRPHYGGGWQPWPCR